MINIDQVRTLESKVKQAIQLITNLKGENQYLKTRLNDYESRIRELENLVNGFKNSQTEIEAGIINALEDLDQLEGSSSDTVENTPQENHSIGSESFQEEEPVSLNSYATPEETLQEDSSPSEENSPEIITETVEEKYGESSEVGEESSEKEEAPQEDQNDLGLGLY